MFNIILAPLKKTIGKLIQFELIFLTRVLKHTCFSREDIDDVDTEVTSEETSQRNPISKLGKSKSEEVDGPGDRSAMGTSGENTLRIIIHVIVSNANL